MNRGQKVGHSYVSTLRVNCSAFFLGKIVPNEILTGGGKNFRLKRNLLSMRLNVWLLPGALTLI